MHVVSRKPVLVTGLGVLLLSCMDAAMKSVSAAYPLAEVIGLRYAAGMVVSAAIFGVSRAPRPDRASLERNFIRAVVVLLTAGSFFTAISRLPLAEAISLTFLAPFFTAMLGYQVLGESVPANLKLGLVFGLFGVCIIGAGQRSDATHALDLVGIGAALTCAFFYALSNIMVRRSRGVDSSIAVVMLSNVFVFLLAFPVMAAGWQVPTASHACIFALSGLLGTAGHLCLAWSYARAQAGTLGVLEYSAFIWASLLGFVAFGEVPSTFTLAGATVIIAACVLSTWTRPPRGAAPSAQPLTPPV